jgi:hypothetical protein
MRPKKNSKRNDLQLSIQMGKKMVGGEWSSKERFARTKLVEFMVDMGNSPDALKFYKKNIVRARANLPQEDRVRILRILAGRKGIIFKVGEKPTEEKLMHLLFKQPLKKKQLN